MNEFPALLKFLTTPLTELDHGQFLLLAYEARNEVHGIKKEDIERAVRKILVKA